MGLHRHHQSHSLPGHTGDRGVISLAWASSSHLRGILQDPGEFVVDFECNLVVEGYGAFKRDFNYFVSFRKIPEYSGIFKMKKMLSYYVRLVNFEKAG